MRVEIRLGLTKPAGVPRRGRFTKSNHLLRQCDSILIEEYLDGREFSVLVAADSKNQDAARVPAIEYRFPEGERFKTAT